MPQPRRSSSPWVCRAIKTRSASACRPKPSSKPAQTTSRRWPSAVAGPQPRPGLGEQHWSALEEAVVAASRGAAARAAGGSIVQQTAQVASADGVVSSSVASGLAKCCGVSVVELQQLAPGQALAELPLERAEGLGDRLVRRRIRRWRKRLRPLTSTPLVPLLSVFTAGAVGYRWTENWDWGDCFWGCSSPSPPWAMAIRCPTPTQAGG